VSVPVPADSAAADERLWLLRAALVLVSPRRVFRSLRDDSDLAARARSEAVLALVLLAGVACVLWTPQYGRLMDDAQINGDGLLVAVIAFVGGGIYSAAVYWAAGLALSWLGQALGRGLGYRQARHVIAFAAAPLALSLVLLWPVRLAVYGDDLFRSGGGDRGTGNAVFVGLELGLTAWALLLLVLGAWTVSVGRDAR
jgi:Yip1 domain